MPGSVFIDLAMMMCDSKLQVQVASDSVSASLNRADWDSSSQIRVTDDASARRRCRGHCIDTSQHLYRTHSEAGGGPRHRRAAAAPRRPWTGSRPRETPIYWSLGRLPRESISAWQPTDPGYWTQPGCGQSLRLAALRQAGTPSHESSPQGRGGGQRSRYTVTVQWVPVAQARGCLSRHSDSAWQAAAAGLGTAAGPGPGTLGVRVTHAGTHDGHEPVTVALPA